MASYFEEVKQLIEAIENITKIDDIEEVVKVYNKIPDSNSQFRLSQLYNIVIHFIKIADNNKREIINNLHNKFATLYEGYGFKKYHGPYCYTYPGKCIIRVESPNGTTVDYKESIYLTRIKEKSYISVIDNGKCIFKCYIDKSRTLDLKLNIQIHDNMTQIVFKNGNDAIYKLCYRDTNNTTIRNPYHINRELDDINYIKIIHSDDLEALKEYVAMPDFDINKEYYYPCCSSYGVCYNNRPTLIEITVNHGAVNCFKYLFSLGANIRSARICYHMMVSGNIEIFRILERTIELVDFLNVLYEFAIKYHRNDIFRYLYEKYGIKNLILPTLISNTFTEYNYKIMEYMKNNNIIENRLYIDGAYNGLLELETSKEAYEYLIQ